MVENEDGNSGGDEIGGDNPITRPLIEFRVHPDAITPEIQEILDLFKDGIPMTFGQFTSIINLKNKFPLGHDPELSSGSSIESTTPEEPKP